MSHQRMNSRTLLHDPTALPVHSAKSSQKSITPPARSIPSSYNRLSMPAASRIMSLIQPKAKHRTTYLALLFLVFLATFVFFFQYPLSPSLSLNRADASSPDQLALALETIQHSRMKHSSHPGVKKHRMQVKLDVAQELAAVSSFLASLKSGNVIPPSVDPSVPIDPQLILDFDTRSMRASAEVEAMVEDVWARNPVFLYSKLYSPASREIKTILSKLHLLPAPTIIDVDIRDDSDILQPLITRLTSIPEFPILIVGGKPVGTVEQVLEMEKSGELQKLITNAGAAIDGAKKRKHRR